MKKVSKGTMHKLKPFILITSMISLLQIKEEERFNKIYTQVVSSKFSSCSCDRKFLKQSPDQDPIVGAYFLFLLAENRIGEFHTELELINDFENTYIKFAVQLETYKMEGWYAITSHSEIIYYHFILLFSYTQFPFFLHQ
jgi:hypothetical protein